MTQTVVVKDNLKLMLKQIQALAATKVLVGVPEAKGQRKGEPISNAALAYIHTNGAPEANIPARPFLIPGIKSVQKETAASFKKAGQAALEGKDFTKNLTAIGLRAASAVKKKITDGPFLPLKPGTLAARRRRGRTGTKPLLDTAQMRNAITFVIRKK